MYHFVHRLLVSHLPCIPCLLPSSIYIVIWCTLRKGIHLLVCCYHFKTLGRLKLEYGRFLLSSSLLCLLFRGSLPLDKGLSSICWYMNLIAIQEYEHPIYFAFMSKHPTLENLVIVGSTNGVVVKLLACWARGPGFDSRSHPYDFRDWLSPASKSRYSWNIAKVT